MFIYCTLLLLGLGYQASDEKIMYCYIVYKSYVSSS